jgi:hypothetical protein
MTNENRMSFDPTDAVALSKKDPERGQHLPTMPDPSKTPESGPHVPTMPDALSDPARGQRLPSDPDPMQRPSEISDPRPRDQGDDDEGVAQVA